MSEEDRDRIKFASISAIFSQKYTLADAFAPGQGRYVKSEAA